MTKKAGRQFLVKGDAWRTPPLPLAVAVLLTSCVI